MPDMRQPFGSAVEEGDRVTYFGVTDSRNTRQQFGIKRSDRTRHTYVIGKTGMGKSTLLENMAVQDIQRGEGLCFIDPHGGTAEKLLSYVPEERARDVLYFAPFDMQYPVSFNVLENVDADKRHLVVAGLMSTFEKIWVDAWSARMAYILQNTLAALLEFPGATLLGVNRMYIDKEYRKNVIAKITDPAVRSFWVDEYSKYTDRYAQEATPAIQNKIGQFASNALVRNVIGQEESAFNIRDLMDRRKIFIVNLSKGRVGEGNANLLGSMLITKIYLAAMSRADMASTRMLPDFFLFVDEFQNFANKSFADILSEARKYKLCLTIAHQYIEQMEEEVAAAVFGNVGTMITFRVGAYDAEVLEKEFAPIFTAEDLVNLGLRQIYLKLMIDGVSSHPFSAVTMSPIPEPTVSYRDRAVAFSRAQFSRPRAEVERDIAAWVSKVYEDPALVREREERGGEVRGAPRAGTGDANTSRMSRTDMQRTPTSPPFPRTERPVVPRARAEQRTQAVAASGGARYDRQEQHTSFERPASSERRLVAPQSPLVRRPVPPVVRPRESAPDLKAILNHLSPSGAERPTPSGAQAASSPTPLIRPDDGKGMSPEGRQQLRDLLTSLAEPAPSKSSQPTTASSVLREERRTEKADRSPRVPMPERRQDLSPDEVRRLLHVRRPEVP